MNVVFYYSQITFRRVELFLGQKSFKLLLFSLRASFVFCLSSHLHAAGHSFLWITSDALSTEHCTEEAHINTAELLHPVVSRLEYLQVKTIVDRK